MRYFFHIGYNGSRYHGWQRQPTVMSVQEVIETQMQQFFKIPITIYGCGRTDAKVHASQFFFHWDAVEPYDFDLKFRLNKMLPPDIAVFDIFPLEKILSARFDAIERTYDYFIHTHKNPFLTQVSSLYSMANLRMDKMQAAAQLLTQYHDFRAFCKVPDKHNTTICKIKTAQVFTSPNNEKIRFQIIANRYLRGMIRIIMHRLLAVGKEECSLQEFEAYLISKQSPPIKQAHPQGLFLSKVVYPSLDCPPRDSFTAMHQNQQANNWILVN